MAGSIMRDDDYQLKQLPPATAMSHGQKAEAFEAEAESEHKYVEDGAQMTYFGKKQQLERNFGLISIVGLTCTLMSTWEGIITVFQSGLNNGGPAGLIYGYLFVWLGNISQALVMAELASMIPLSGGQYNWVAILSPQFCSKFLSYLTGWVTIIGWQAGLASAAFLGGTMIQGLLVLNHPSYNFQRWHGTLLFSAIIAISLFVNTYLARLLPKIEVTTLVLHIVGFFAILIPMVYLGPRASTKDVFKQFINSGNWSTDGLSFFIGLSTSMFAFIGIDAASHIAEEIENASTILPRSMIFSVILNGILGLGMILALLFCIGDIDAALKTPTGFPFIEIFTQATNSTAGGTAMAAVIIAAFVFADIVVLTTASRMTWAFAREKGLPGSSILARVEPRTRLPLWSIGLSTLISLLLALINIGSATAFNALVSLVIAAFYSSFLVAATVMLVKRVTTPETAMRWGPFRLGRFGLPVTVFSIIYSIIGIFFSFWPASSKVTAETMNWSVVVYGGALIFSMIFWVIYGRKVYTGPIVEIRQTSN